MRAVKHHGAIVLLWAALWATTSPALDAQMPLLPSDAAAPAPVAESAAVSATPPVPTLAPPSTETNPAAGLNEGEEAAVGLSASAVAGIPLEDGSELVLGPQEKVSTDDHKVAAERFQHMRQGGKLSASSDLDREVPRILKREQSGDIRGALLAARTALARLPEHQNLRQITARLQIANGDFGSALLTLAPLLEIDRDNWLPFYWAGIAELMQLNLDNARAYLARASSLDADRPEPWIARAVVEQEAGNFAGSLQLFVVARQRSPARAEILNGIAYSQAMLQQSGGAVQGLNSTAAVEAIAAQPSPPPAAVSPLAGAGRAPPAVGNAPAFASGADNTTRGTAPSLMP